MTDDGIVVLGLGGGGEERLCAGTWKSDFAFALVSFSPWCLGVACGVRRIGFGMRALLGSTGRISVFSALR